MPRRRFVRHNVVVTIAVCLKCGAQKHGALTTCPACGYRPEDYEDQAKSIYLTDHYLSLEDLERVGRDIADGHTIRFDPEQVAQFAALIEMEGRRTRRGCWLGLVIVVAVVVYLLVR